MLLSSIVVADDFMRVAHRGAPNFAPENTLPAFKKAIELKANFLEFDVHLTKDGKLVVIHDTTVDRTSNGSGKVANLNFSELRKLDAGSWYSDEFQGEVIPTLKEVFDLMKPYSNVKAIIELKVAGPEQEIINLINETELKDRVIVKSFSPKVLDNLKKIAIDIPSLYVFVWGMKNIPFTINTAPRFQGPFEVPAQILQPHYYFTSAAFISKAHKLGYKVVVWGVDTEEQMQKVISMKADGIETDHLDLLNKVIESKK